MYHGLLYKKPGYDLAPHKDAVSNTPEPTRVGCIGQASSRALVYSRVRA
jgi:hypothetical protein